MSDAVRNLLMMKAVAMANLVVQLTGAWVRPELGVYSRLNPLPVKVSKVEAAEVLKLVESVESREAVENLEEEEEYLEEVVLRWEVKARARLDQALREASVESGSGLFESRSRWGEAVKKGAVRVNGNRCERKAHTVETGDVVEVTAHPVLDESWREYARAEAIPLDVLYEDDDIIVVNKQPGLVTHPAPGHRNGTLANALAHHCRGAPVFVDQPDPHPTGGPRPGIVHRLDKGTSGAIVAAKTPLAQERLAASFRERAVTKLYLAVCARKPDTDLAVVTEALARDPVKRDRMAVNPDGRHAKSTVRLLASDGRRSVVQVDIATGRTHQIRVHLAHLGAPVLGDDLYGDPTHNRAVLKPPFNARRPLLHAWQLAFPHPTTGETISITAPPPEDITNAITRVSGILQPPPSSP